MGTDTSLKKSKKGTLTKRSEFERVYRLGTTKLDRLLVVRIISNNLNSSRFGYSISKKLGCAVTRNHIKRLLREIVRLTDIKPGFDVVLIARSDAVNASYDRLRKSFLNLLEQYKLVIYNHENHNSETN